MVLRFIRWGGRLLVVLLCVMVVDTILGAHVQIIDKGSELAIDAIGGAILAVIVFLIIGRIFHK